MQAIWKGTISFGLVTIPVKLYSATEEKDVSLRQVHDVDGGRIKYRRFCSIDGEEVPYGHIARGYETPDGGMVVLEDADFADLVDGTLAHAIDRTESGAPATGARTAERAPAPTDAIIMHGCGCAARSAIWPAASCPAAGCCDATTCPARTPASTTRSCSSRAPTTCSPSASNAGVPTRQVRLVTKPGCR